MNIKRSELVNLCIECLEKGYERFKSDTTNGKSIQEVLMVRAKEDITRQEMVEIFKALPELKALKSKKRVINIVDDSAIVEHNPLSKKPIDVVDLEASMIDAEDENVHALDAVNVDEEEEDFFNH